ncbi:lipoprotein [Spiroplasma floricola]|uniref:Lipoprotein n=1 Tax=Spiroplasma floricola 23-6 TaxID=1336749 RepID=A0A2K8SFR8_9MOLU|nr:lipoprotein [Spiroplasma floricola]AUB31670.1 hypothetical protein SFLOR_v1c06200 [Spiroplasma floricola 23-6]
MKKLLSLLAATGLVATTSATVVACGQENRSNISLNKSSIDIEQGSTGEILITSDSDLTGIKITGQVENKVTTEIEGKKITIKVSETAEVKDYILEITGTKIHDKAFTVKVKEKGSVQKDVTLDKDSVEIIQGQTGEVNITSTNDLTYVIIKGQVADKVTAKIETKKITITVSETAEIKDYTLIISGTNINEKEFTVKVKEKTVGKTDVTLDKNTVEITQGQTGEVNITSTNDLTGMTIEGQVANKVTTTISNKKITVTVSQDATVQNYNLTIKGTNINDKAFTVNVKAKTA